MDHEEHSKPHLFKTESLKPPALDENTWGFFHNTIKHIRTYDLNTPEEIHVIKNIVRADLATRQQQYKPYAERKHPTKEEAQQAGQGLKVFRAAQRKQEKEYNFIVQEITKSLSELEQENSAFNQQKFAHALKRLISEEKPEIEKNDEKKEKKKNKTKSAKIEEMSAEEISKELHITQKKMDGLKKALRKKIHPHNVSSENEDDQ